VRGGQRHGTMDSRVCQHPLLICRRYRVHEDFRAAQHNGNIRASDWQHPPHGGTQAPKAPAPRAPSEREKPWSPPGLFSLVEGHSDPRRTTW